MKDYGSYFIVGLLVLMIFMGFVNVQAFSKFANAIEQQNKQIQDLQKTVQELKK